MLSSAQNAVPEVIPYTGYLEANGREGAGPIQMRFALFSDADGNNELWRSWSDDATWHDITLTAGRFTVNLGGVDQEDLDDDQVFNSDTHYLQIYIRAGTPPTPHTLPLQALKSVPKAVLAQRATNFTVTQSLNARNVTVNDTLRVTGDGPHRVNGSLEVVEADHLTVGGVKMPPPGMVAAFYRSTCPPGWRDLATANGTWNFGDGNIRVSPIGGRFLRVASNRNEMRTVQAGTYYWAFNQQYCHGARGCAHGVDNKVTYVHQRRVRIFDTDSGAFDFNPSRNDGSNGTGQSGRFRPSNIRLLHCVRLP